MNVLGEGATIRGHSKSAMPCRGIPKLWTGTSETSMLQPETSETRGARSHSFAAKPRCRPKCGAPGYLWEDGAALVHPGLPR